MKLSPIADQLADQLKRKWSQSSDWNALRDQIDLKTGWEHPTKRLDTLANMVMRRLPLTLTKAKRG